MLFAVLGLSRGIACLQDTQENLTERMARRVGRQDAGQKPDMGLGDNR